MEYGGFWIRVGAYIIDAIILAVVGGVLGGIFGVGLGAATAGGADAEAMLGGSLLMNLLSLAIGIAYFAGMESSSWQATIGKKAVGLVVVDNDGNRISLGRAIGRYFAKILSALILFIGYIMVAFTDRKQGLHDLICGTLVVHGQPGTHGTAGVFD